MSHRARQEETARLRRACVTVALAGPALAAIVSYREHAALGALAWLGGAFWLVIFLAMAVIL